MTDQRRHHVSVYLLHLLRTRLPERATAEECGIIQHYKGSDHIGQSECPTFPSPLFQMVTVISLDRPSPPPPPSHFLKGHWRRVKNRTCPTKRPSAWPRTCTRARIWRTPHRQPRRVSYAPRVEEPTDLEWRIFLSSIFSKAPGPWPHMCPPAATRAKCQIQTKQLY